MTNWKNAAYGSWTDPTAWDTGAVPGPLDDVAISVPGFYQVSLTASISSHSLVIGDADAALEVADPGGTDAFSGDVTNAGEIGLDYQGFNGQGGSTVTVGGTLTNTGSVIVGQYGGGLSAPTLLSVGTLVNSGTITVSGGTGTAAVQAELDAGSAAPATLAGQVDLEGDALLRYASGQVGTIASGASLVLSGANARLADAADTTTNSALTGLAENDGVFVVDGDTVAIAGGLDNTGQLDLNSSTDGSGSGAAVAIAGTLSGAGSISVQSNGPSTGSLLSAGALAMTGNVTIQGNGGTQAALEVATAAPGTLGFSATLGGDSLLQYASGQIGAIAGGATLVLNGPNARVSDAADTTTNSALVGLAENDGVLRVVNGSSIAIAGDFANTGGLGVDSDSYTSEGGSTITVAGTLTNTGNIYIGPATNGLSATALLSVGALAGAGGVNIHGSTGATPAQAELEVGSAAPSTLVASLFLDGDSLLQYASGEIGTIAANTTLQLNGPVARVADASDPATNSALTGLTENDGVLRVVNGDSVAIAGDLANTNALGVDSDDYTSEGGSTITVGGTLTNTGNIYIGPGTNGLSAAALLSVGALAGTGGVYIRGSYGAAPAQAEIAVGSAAPGTLTGTTNLDGDALLQYAQGQIGTIAANVTLVLNGPNARVADASDTTTNSALVGLAENDGTLRVINGDSVAIGGNFDNTGGLGVDSDDYTSEGGSTITVAGTLTNTGNVFVGPGTNGLSAAALLSVGALAGTGGVYLRGSYGAAPVQAELAVGSAAPGTLTGTTNLDGDALLQYASGQIGTIASGVSLVLNGRNARVADASDTTTNSALAGLAENDGTLRVINGDSVAIAGDLANTGALGVDGDSYTSEGGSTVTVAGTLTNTGDITIGPGTNGLSSNDLLSVGALAGAGGVNIHGSTGATPAQAELEIGSAAPATLTGNTTLDGDALLQYASGQIGTIATNVTLLLNGPNARVADASGTTTNSALTGLTENDGTLRVVNGASVAIAGNLANTGGLGVDSDSYTAEGGSTVTVAGTLTNTGSVTVGPGTDSLSAPALLSVGALAGAGSVGIHGSPTVQAELADGAAAPATLAANTTLDGDSLLQYATGTIGTIASGVSLLLNGPKARVADASDTTTNSALTGLGENDGTLRVINGDRVAIAGNLDNTGGLGVDSDGYTSEGGSTVAIAGTLTNTGSVTVGPGTAGLSAGALLAVAGLVNSGSIVLTGNSAAIQAVLADHGDVRNTGSLDIGANAVLQLDAGDAYMQTAGTTTVSGTLDAGAIEIAGGSFVVDGGSVSASEIDLVGTGATIGFAAGAAGPAINGFVQGNTIELLGGTATQLHPVYSSATGQTTLTVTFSDSSTRTATLVGDYTNAVFAIGQSGGNSTITTSSTSGAAVAAIEGVGATSVPNQFTLDLGTTTLGGPALGASLAVLNAASAPADLLGGSFAVMAAPGFTNTGFGTFSGLAVGNAHTDPSVSLGSATLGTFTESVVLTPVDDHLDGSTSPLGTQTVTITGTVARKAAAAFSVSPDYLHTGDPGTAALVISNIDPADGTSASLQATITGVSGGISATAGAKSGVIAPGASDASLAIAVSTQQSGQLNGALGIDLQSVASGGTIDLGITNVPLTVYVDNYAVATLTEASGGGTVGMSGAATTIDLGTIAANSGPLTVGIAAANAAAGQADQLSGTLAATGSSGFAANGLGKFMALGAGQADTAPQVTLDTTQLGQQTETITLTPQGSNPSGFTEPLPAETITVKANVAVLPPPVIGAPAALSGTAAIPVIVGPFTVSDPNTLTQPVTLTLTDAAGALAATASGHATLAGDGSGRLVIKGSIADINATLASLTYIDTTAGSDTIDASLVDQHDSSASTSIAVTTAPAPLTGAVFNQPAFETAVLGQPNGLAGLSLSDPYAEANGDVVSVTLTTAIGTLGVNNPPDGAMVTGQGTDTIVLTGTVQQINATLADDGFFAAIVAPIDLIAYLVSVAKHVVTQAAINVITGTYNNPLTKEDLISSLGGPGGKVFSFGVALASFELNSIAAAAVGAPPPDAKTFQVGAIAILADAHIVEPDGTIFDFNPAGEFVLAASTQSGDSFDVQVRIQPLGASQSASVITQVAASLGNDRVTFAVGRTGTVWVNGAAVSLTQGAPDLLSGGELTQVSANSYNLVWNTGEVLTVTDSGSYLNATVAPGPNNSTGSIVGLASLGNAGDLQLPDGTVLSQPLTTAQLYQVFANDWRVPQQDSLLDYGPGQTTATFTDTNFPQAPVTLADFPANVVAAAAAVAAAAGITDPGVLAAAEFDYIASGGDASFVMDDASLLAGRTTTPAMITPGPTPVTAGVLADKPKAFGDGINPISAVFDIYLTAPAATDATIAYAVTAAGAGFLGSAAFGGTLPSGSVVIPAGQTSAQVTISVPAFALGTLPSEKLALSISAAPGVSVFSGTAQEILAQPVAGPPPLPQIADLTRLGTFTQTGNGYALDLGEVQYGEPLPAILFSVMNGASGSADSLGGNFSVRPADGFTVTGANLPEALDPGQSYDGLNVAVNFTKFGPNSQTITFTPQDSNGSGFSAPLPTETLTIKDTIVAPSMVFSQAWGDVHIVTYNGLRYDFQEVGEFTLAKSRDVSDSFDIQLRLQPWYNSAVVSVITQVAVSVGTDHLTFDNTRPDFVQVDGVASTVSSTDPLVNLDGGTLNYVAPNVFQVKWDTGEEATITSVTAGSHGYINVSDGIPLSLPNSVGGLQGEDAGGANDFQLPDGTVLPQPLTYDQLHHEFADGWRVSQAASLFDYLPGQTTATFTDTNFPTDVLPVASLPQAAQIQATALVAAAGITDPGLAAAAEEDYLATGDASFIGSAAAVQAQVATTTTLTPTNIPAAAPLAGVEAPVAAVPEAADGQTAVAFTVYLTAVSATDTTVNTTVVDGGAGFLGAAAFGGAVPAGSVVVPAGQTSAPLTIDVPAGALGTTPSDQLEVQITGTSGPAVLTPTAAVTVVNAARVPGATAVPLLTDLTDPAALTATGATSYTLNLGQLGQGAPALLQQLSLENAAAAPADSLSGAFAAPLGNGFIISGDSLRSALAAGASFTGLHVTADTTLAGSHTLTLTFSPTDVNESGYAAALPAITLTVIDQVGSLAGAALDSPNQILFPNAHVGAIESSPISIANTAAAPAQALDVTTTVGGAATATGSIAGLAAGQTDTSSLSVGLDTSQAGQLNGVVLLAAASDGGAAGRTPLPDNPTVDVFGSAYRPATTTIVPPASTILHVGDPGALAIQVANTAAADGFSENLVASIGSVSGGITATASRPTGEIAPGAATSALIVNVPTAMAGIVAGTATVDLVSDGGTGGGSVDGLGQTALAAQTVPVGATVDNFAQAALASTGAALTSTGLVSTGPDSYTLNLGTVQAGSSVAPIALQALNTAAGPADLLDGSYTVGGDAPFAATGFGAFAGVAAGSSEQAGTVALDTSQPGAFSETIVLHPTGENASGFSQALPDQTLTIDATVANSGTATTDVHLATFDGLRYDFQADGDFTLAQSTVSGNPFQIQVETTPFALIQATSLITKAAAQIGGNVVTVALDGTVTVNGVADTSIGAASPHQLLDGGSLTALGNDGYQLTWANGEQLTIANEGFCLNLSTALAPTDGAGSVQGLLGALTGQANDLQLPDGTVLAQPASDAALLGQYADAWRVSPSQTILNGSTVALRPSDLGAAGSMCFIHANAPGEVLTGSLGAGAAEAGGLTIGFTAATLPGAVIADFAAADRIDVSGLAGGAAFSFAGSATGGQLTIGTGADAASLRVIGGGLGSLHYASDQHGGTLISLG